MDARSQPAKTPRAWFSDQQSQGNSLTIYLDAAVFRRHVVYWSYPDNVAMTPYALLSEHGRHCPAFGYLISSDQGLTHIAFANVPIHLLMIIVPHWRTWSRQDEFTDL